MWLCAPMIRWTLIARGEDPQPLGKTATTLRTCNSRAGGHFERADDEANDTDRCPLACV